MLRHELGEKRLFFAKIVQCLLGFLTSHLANYKQPIEWSIALSTVCLPFVHVAYLFFYLYAHPTMLTWMRIILFAVWPLYTLVCPFVYFASVLALLKAPEPFDFKQSLMCAFISLALAVSVAECVCRARSWVPDSFFRTPDSRVNDWPFLVVKIGQVLLHTNFSFVLGQRIHPGVDEHNRWLVVLLVFLNAELSFCHLAYLFAVFVLDKQFNNSLFWRVYTWIGVAAYASSSLPIFFLVVALPFYFDVCLFVLLHIAAAVCIGGDAYHIYHLG